MAPTASPSERSVTREQPGERVGPHPSYIEVAKPYMLQSRIQKCLTDIGMSDAKEDAVRLQGVSYIDQVRRALQLPVRTFNTAVTYYHKFRLLHADNEYNFADAAAAALFTACKIEDTLKKSREILAAHWNLKVGVGEQLSSDDPRFENHSKLIIVLERLMLESAGFDFRNRYPQKLMVKMARTLDMDKNNAAKTAWNLSIDLYRTFAPLKQTAATMAIACLELAARLHEINTAKIIDAGPVRYKNWKTSRAETMETLLDLLDLYTHHRSSTLVGPLYSLETFINIRITLNQEASAAGIPRYAMYESESASKPSPHTSNGLKPRNGIEPTSPLTPASPNTISPGTVLQPPTSAIGIKGLNGTVRFMLDPQRARDERAEVDRFWKVEEEEYEVEVPVESEREKITDRDRDRDRENRDRDWDRRREFIGPDFVRRFSSPSFDEHIPYQAHFARRVDRGRVWGRTGGRTRGRDRDRSRSPARIDFHDDERNEARDQGRSSFFETDRRHITTHRGRGRGRGHGRGRGRGRLDSGSDGHEIRSVDGHARYQLDTEDQPQDIRVIHDRHEFGSADGRTRYQWDNDVQLQYQRSVDDRRDIGSADGRARYEWDTEDQSRDMSIIENWRDAGSAEGQARYQWDTEDHPRDMRITENRYDIGPANCRTRCQWGTDDRPRYLRDLEDQLRHGNEMEDQPWYRKEIEVNLRYMRDIEDRPQTPREIEERPHYGREMEVQLRSSNVVENQLHYGRNIEDLPLYERTIKDPARYGRGFDDRSRYGMDVDEPPRYQRDIEAPSRHGREIVSPPRYGWNTEDRPRYGRDIEDHSRSRMEHYNRGVDRNPNRGRGRGRARGRGGERGRGRGERRVYDTG